MTNNRCQRHRNIDAIARSSIHQSLATPSSQMAMARSKSSTLNDPKQALDLVRSVIQSDINEKIQYVMQEYVDSIFQPALHNMRQNLGEAAVGPHLIEEVVANALDQAKLAFKAVKSNESNLSLKRKLPPPVLPGAKKCCPSKPEDKIKREGPKWDTKRINHDTLFLLGVKATRLLGYKRGSRLYAAHPTLFKYTLDQEDRDRLVEANVIPARSSGKKVNVLVAEDVIEIAENMEVKASEILRHAFKCPPGMIDKMKIFIDLVKTETKAPPIMNNGGDQPVSDEDLGFLQNMNLTNLVREFEMEAAASGQGSQNLPGILSLADDGSENPFSELEDPPAPHDIEFE